MPGPCIPQTHRYARIMARISTARSVAKGWQSWLNPQARQAAADTMLLGPKGLLPQIALHPAQEDAGILQQDGAPFSWEESVSRGYCWDRADEET